MENTNEIIVGIGECLFDLFPDGVSNPSGYLFYSGKMTGYELGGAPTNFAYHAGQLLGKNNAYVISARNNKDIEGVIMENELDSRGIQRIIPTVADYCTGAVIVSQNGNGPQYLIKEDMAYDHIPFTKEMESLATKATAVCFGTLAQRCSVSRNTIQRFLENTTDKCIKIFDINLRQNYFNKEIIEDSLKRCNVLKLNDDELPVVCQMFGINNSDPEVCCRKIMSQWDINTTIFTCGAEGSYIFSHNETSYKKSKKVNLVSSVGAGDSFTAAYCAATLKGLPLAQVHQLAVEVSAYVCTQNGAMPKLPKEIVKQLK